MTKKSPRKQCGPLTENAVRILGIVVARGHYICMDLHKNTVKALLRRELVQYSWTTKYGVAFQTITPTTWGTDYWELNQ